MHNAHSMSINNYKARLKLSFFWHLFTPDAKKKIRTICNEIHNKFEKDASAEESTLLTFFNYVGPALNKAKNTPSPASFSNLAPILNKVDSKLLHLLLDREERSSFSQEQQTEMKKIDEEFEKLLNKGFTHEQSCNQLFGTLITKNGCALPLDETPSPFALQELIAFLVMQKELNDKFD
jgi:hypothetical protein